MIANDTASESEKYGPPSRQPKRRPARVNHAALIFPVIPRYCSPMSSRSSVYRMTSSIEESGNTDT